MKHFILFLNKHDILCDANFNVYYFVCVTFQACYDGLSICAYSYIAEIVNRLLVYLGLLS